MNILDRVRAAAGAATGAGPIAATGAATTGFDHVEMPAKGDDLPRRLDKRQFEALPLQERVGLLVQGTLRFYRGDKEVAPSEAMRSAY